MSEKIPDVSHMVAVRATDATWTEEAGKVSVRRRRFGPVRAAILRVFGVPRDFTVHLDGLGSEVWLLLDGTRTLGDVRIELEKSHPGEPDLAIRLGKFVGAMVSRKMVELRGQQTR